MSLFSFKKKREYFSPAEQQQLVEAIKAAEKNTSGEVRVFVEGRCKYVDAVDRAREIFYDLEMQETKERNAVLLYIALDDHQLALFADEGVYNRLGANYWHDEVRKMISSFTRHDYIAGICSVVQDIGLALQTEFPYESSDKNELPDDIIFGH